MWSKGGIITDPPGLGKTLINITCVLIHQKLKLKDLPALMEVKRLVTLQFVNEFQCFVHCIYASGSSSQTKRERKILLPEPRASKVGSDLGPGGCSEL